MRFLTAFAQALSTMTLYTEGHPARERVIDGAFDALLQLLAHEPKPHFTFLGDEALLGREPLRELRAWDWTPRLSNAGVQRIEFDPDVTREELESFLDDVLARLTLSAISSASARQLRSTRIRFGSVGVRGELESLPEVPTATLDLSLGVEAETIRWLHHELQSGHSLHLSEAEAVVRSLAVAMHGDRQIMIPLLTLRNYDEYTTTHSLNVSVLAMAFAEHLGLVDRDVRAFGVAGLLHDIGKVNIPPDVLNKPGRLSPEERTIMDRHPADGARILIETEKDVELAAVVAYEHHIMIDGGGYPLLKYPRDCHFASKLIHVCDVYDALRTERPYRAAWPMPRVIAYIAERAGVEFEADLARAFCRMMELWEPSVVTLDEHQPPAG